MPGESDIPTGGEQMSEDTLAQARIDCRAAFDRGLAGAELAGDATSFPDRLFNRTVKDAIEKGFQWKKDGRTETALKGMENIAAQAADEARAQGRKDVPFKRLEWYEKEVIKAGKNTCNAKSAARRDAIFCVLYAPDGTYGGP